MKAFSSPRVLTTIILISVLLRVAPAFYMGNAVEPLPGIFDQVSYHTLALRVLAGHGFSFGETWWPVTAAGAPTAHWSYLYTLFLTGVYAVFGPHPLAARLIQVLIAGALQPWLAYLIGKRVFNRTTGLVAAALTACYAYFIYYAAALMTESFFITAVMASLYLAITWKPAERSANWSGLALGACMGIAVLLRQLFLFMSPLIMGWLVWSHWKRSRQLNWKGIVISLVVPAVMIMPFSLYNTARFHRFVLLNTNAGYAFFWANHPIYGTKFIEILPPEIGDYVSLIPQELQALDEAGLEKELMRRGLGFVLQDPGRYVLLSLSRIPAYFKFWHSSGSGAISNLARVASFGILWPFMLAGVFLAVVRRQETRLQDWLAAPASLLLLFAFMYTGIHLLSWALIRYRLPVDAVLLVFASLAARELAGFLRRKARIVQPIVSQALGR